MNSESSFPPNYYALLTICCAMVFGCYFGTYMRFPVVPLASALGADTMEVGLINGAFLLVAGVLSLPLGLVSARLGTKSPPWQDLDAVRLFFFGGRQPHPAPTYLDLPLFRGGAGGLWPHHHGLCGRHLSAHPPGPRYGWYTTALYVGMSLGPAVGGFSAEAGLPMAFFLSGLSIFLAFWIMFFFLPRARQVMSADYRRLPLGRAVVREFSHNLPLLGSWLATGAGCFSLGLFITYLPLHAHARGLTYSHRPDLCHSGIRQCRLPSALRLLG